MHKEERKRKKRRKENNWIKIMMNEKKQNTKKKVMISTKARRICSQSREKHGRYRLSLWTTSTINRRNGETHRVAESIIYRSIVSANKLVGRNIDKRVSLSRNSTCRFVCTWVSSVTAAYCDRINDILLYWNIPSIILDRLRGKNM